MNRRAFLQHMAALLAAPAAKSYFVFGNGLWRPESKVEIIEWWGVATHEAFICELNFTVSPRMVVRGASSGRIPLGENGAASSLAAL